MISIESTLYRVARTAMFLKGVTYGIIQECPSMQIDAGAVRKTKGVAGVVAGDFNDFVGGMILTSTLLKSQRAELREHL